MDARLCYKKPIIPLLAFRDAGMPFRLEPRQRTDFTSAYDSALRNCAVILPG